VVPNVNATVHLGNPLEGGTNIAFNQCQNGPDGVVLLETITGFATSEVTDVELRIEPHTAPSNPNQQCVNLINCSSPFFTRFCVDGSSAIINKVHSQACEPLDTQPSSWAGVKSLYQQ
jgi:hypothetical protein